MIRVVDALLFYGVYQKNRQKQIKQREFGHAFCATINYDHCFIV